MLSSNTKLPLAEPPEALAASGTNFAGQNGLACLWSDRRILVNMRSAAGEALHGNRCPSQQCWAGSRRGCLVMTFTSASELVERLDSPVRFREPRAFVRIFRDWRGRLRSSGGEGKLNTTQSDRLNDLPLGLKPDRSRAQNSVLFSS